MNEEGLQKLKHYCAYQERSHKEVRSKLLSLKIYGQDLEDIIVALIAEDYLNEERYARAIARGKFYQKQWGRNKILQTLKLQEVSSYCIKKAMSEIDDHDYLETLKKLADKKSQELKSERNKFTKLAKLRNFLLQKGYEYEYINQVIQVSPE